MKCLLLIMIPLITQELYQKNFRIRYKILDKFMIIEWGCIQEGIEGF